MLFTYSNKVHTLLTKKLVEWVKNIKVLYPIKPICGPIFKSILTTLNFHTTVFNYFLK